MPIPLIFNPHAGPNSLLPTDSRSGPSKEDILNGEISRLPHDTVRVKHLDHSKFLTFINPHHAGPNLLQPTDSSQALKYEAMTKAGKKNCTNIV